MYKILYNGRFFVPSEGDIPHTFASCIVIDEAIGNIAYVGSMEDDEVSEFTKVTNTTLQDMNGFVVIPGFIDSHMHVLQTGEALKKLDLSRCKSLDEIRVAIKGFAIANPQAPRLLCRSWRHPATGGNELATQLDDLDSRPIYIDADDLHSSWCNTAALEELGVADMSDPPGGKIHRDVDGKPSGLLSETASIGLVWPFLSSLTTVEQKVDMIKGAFDAYIAAGYTGVVEMATDEHVWEVLQSYRKRYGELPVWLASHWFIFPRETQQETLKQVDRAIELQQQYDKVSSPLCRITGIKIMCDGVVDACTAHLLEPYSHTGENEPPAWTIETLVPILQKADKAGLQCAIHAIGDGAIRIAIDSLETVGNYKGRHRIEHLEMCSPEDVTRLGKLGITASVQAVHCDPAGLEAWPKLIGESRCQNIFPYGAMAKFGAAIALGTDSPTAPYDPLPNLYIATTRRSAFEPDMVQRTTPEFALNLVAAVSATTYGAARSCFEEDRVGSLKRGLRANLSVIDMDWDADKLLDARVIETWISGQKVYQRDS